MTTRITGLYSNLDVDSLVSAGVSLYQNKVDKAKQQEQILEWKQEQYQSIQSDVSDFYDDYLTTTGENSLLMSSNWNTKSFTSSNESAVSVTSTSDANVDNYTVSVTQLATAAKAEITKDSLVSGNKLTINGETYTLSGTTQSTIISNLNSLLTTNKAGITASYSSYANSGAGGLVLESDTLGDDTTLTIAATIGTVTSTKGTNLEATITNGSNSTYTITDGTSNTTTLDGITFTFNETTSTKSTKNITSASVNNLLGDYITGVDTSNLKSTSTTTAGVTTTTTSGYTDYMVSDSSNTVYRVRISTGGTTSLYKADGTTPVTTGSIILSDGTEINYDGTVTTADDNAVSITGTNDVSDLQDKIESFIDDYNTLLETINGKIYESYDSDYLPLTDSQEGDMSETEITSWNTKAQTGLLRHDSYLEDLASDMKSAMSSFFKSAGIDIESIGIEAVDDYTTKNGTYSVDSDTLESALEGSITKKDSITGNTKTITFDDIKSLFTNGYSSVTSLTTKSSTSSTDGLLSRLKVALNINAYMSSSELAKRAGIEGTTSETTNEITLLLNDQNDLIDELEEKLADREDALYAKYATLETYLSSLSSSSSLFSSSSS